MMVAWKEQLWEKDCYGGDLKHCCHNPKTGKES